MLGLEIKITGSCKADILSMIDEVRKELENNADNMYIPANDIAGSEADFSLCEIGELDIYDNWDNCNVVTL